MSVDVASLVFAFDSTSAAPAEAAMDRLIVKGAQLETTAKKVRTATDRMNEGYSGASGTAQQASQGALGLAQAQGAVEKASLGAAAASRTVREARALEAAAMREMVLASKQYEASLASQARQEAAAAASKARLAAQVDNILGGLNPLVKVQNSAAASTAKLDQALAAGVISAEKHAAATLAVKTAALEASTATNVAEQALGHMGGTSRKTREALVLLHEFIRGDFKRGIGSATIELQNFGLLEKIFSPIGIGIGLVAAALAVLVVGAFKGGQEIEKFGGSLIATGNYAGLTTSSLYTMSAAVAASSDGTVLSSRKTIEALASSGKFSQAAILSLADAAEQYARITGENADKFVKEYDGMKDKLVEFAVKHEDVYHDLTLAEVQAIADLVKHGKEQAAQELLAEDIDRAAKARAKEKMEQEEGNYGLLQQWARNLKENWTDAWDAILGIGRPASAAEKVVSAVSKLSADSFQVQQLRQTPLGNTPAARALQDKALAADYAAVNAAQAAAKQESDKAAADAAEAKKNHDAIQAVFGDGKSHGTKSDPVAERLQALAAEAAGNRLLATTTDLTTAAGVRALAQQKALADAAKETKHGTDLQTASLKFYQAELDAVVTAAAKTAEEEVAKTNAQSKATEQATALVAQYGVSQGVANQMVADANRLATLHAAYDVASLKDKPLLAKAINDTAVAQERKNKADQDAFLAGQHAAATDQLVQLQLEISLIGKSNEERAVAIAQLREEQTLRQQGVQPKLLDGSANPAYVSAVDDAKTVAKAQAQLAAGQDNYNNSLSQTLNLLGEIAAQNQALGSSLASTFGSAGSAIGSLIGTLSQYAVTQERIRVEEAAARKAAGSDAKALADLDVLYAKKRQTAEVETNLAALDSFKSLFSTKSSAYKVLTDLEIAYQVVQLAGHVKALAMSAIETATSIANSIRAGIASAAAGAAKMFEVLGPLGFAAVAAMVAVLAGMGLSTGGGGGGSSITDAATQQKQQGTGTVLGDVEAKSDSIAKALDLVAKNTNKDLEYSNGMLIALRSIDANMSTLTAALARSLQLNTAGGSGGLTPGVTSSGFGVRNGLLGVAGGAAGFLAGGILSGTLGALAANTALAVGASTALAGSIGEAILAAAGPIGLAIGALAAFTLKTKVETDLKDSGVLFSNQSIADVLQNGVAAQSYGDFSVTSKTNFLGIGAISKSTKNVEQTQALDAGVQRDISLVITSIANSVVAAAKALGVAGADETIKQFQIEIGKVSLQGLKGQDLTDAISAIFSKLGDQMADFLVPAVEQFQKAGEGLLETLVRVARDYQVVDISLQSIGKTFGQVGVASIAARENLVGLFGSLDEFVSETQFFADNFLSDSERIAPIIKAVDDQLTALGLSGINTKEAFKNLVEGLDLSTDAGAAMYANLLALAPAFAKVIDFMTNGSQDVTDARDALTKAYQNESQAIQDTQTKFQSFADSLKAFATGLDTGPNALLTPEQQYNATTQAFLDTSAKAKLGDADALGNLQNVSQAYLDASKAYYASSGHYFQDLASVKDAVTAAQGTAQRTADNATQQLDALKASVSGLITINDSVLSVKDAIVALQAAMSAVGGASLPVFTGGTGTPPVLPTPDAGTPTPVTPTATDPTGGVTVPVTIDPSQIQQALAAGGYGGGGYLGPSQFFADEGSFMVGGSGAGDSQNFGPFNAAPGEMVSIRHGNSNDNAELISEIKALKAEVVALRGQVARGDQANVEATKAAGQGIEKAVKPSSKDRLVTGGRAA